MTDRNNYQQDLNHEQLIQMRSFDYPPPPLPPIHPDLQQASYPAPQHATTLPPIHPYGPPQYSNDLSPPQQAAAQVDHVGQATGGETQTTRANRLRKACDACSVRKVKCDEAGPPCRACASLDIPCTFDRPSRRRGPPNKHAEAMKRQRLDQHGAAVSMPASPSPAVQQQVLAPLLQQEQYLNAESICPMDLLEMLIDDYFIFCHPLTPFPHETWYREEFAQRRDQHDQQFLALTAGMIGHLTASFPRRPRKHMRALRRENLFSSSLDLINRCQSIAHEARGTGHLERPLCAYDAAVSYFLFGMLSCTYRINTGRLYLSECIAMLVGMNLNDEGNPGQTYLPPQGSSGESAGEGAAVTSKIEVEMARRVFWTAFVTTRSLKTMGYNFVESSMILPNPRPPLPLEADDQYIYVDAVDLQPQGTVSRLIAFNANVRIYLSLEPMYPGDLAHNIGLPSDWQEQLRLIDSCLEVVKHCLDSLPEELTAWPRATSRSPSIEEYGFVKRELFDTSQPNGSMTLLPSMTTAERRYVTFETQKANINTSCLSVRSYFVERRWALIDAHVPPQIDASIEEPQLQRELRAEREAIAQDLLSVLSYIRPIHIEPNSISLFLKLRQVAATLIPLSAGPVTRTGENGERAALTGEDRASGYLRQFLEMLTDLEKCGKRGPSSDEGIGVDDEEEELRRWADLREHQKRFANES